MKRSIPLIMAVLAWLLLLSVAVAAPPQQDEGQDYVVQADDWLSKLADKFYGDVLAYSAIVEATNAKAGTDNSYAAITNPDIIEVGQKLFIPSADTATATLAASSAPAASGFPLTLENCGLTYTYTAPPKRAVSMNQAATEIMLALGLQDKLIGTAYLDDEILPEYQAAYQEIPVLAKEYPSQEVLFAADPDFVYGSYSSAFDEEAAGAREDLLQVDITSYVSPAACADKSLRPDTVTIDTVYGEIRDIGHIFGIDAQAETLIAGLQAKLAEVKTKIGSDTEPVQIFWFDSVEKGPYTGACCGAPGEIMRLVGAENIFADTPGSWAEVSWEEVVARNPAAIVLTQAEWSTAEEKIALLKDTPAYADIAAVQQARFIAIPFSATTPGIRNVSAVEALAKGLYPDKFE